MAKDKSFREEIAEARLQPDAEEVDNLKKDNPEFQDKDPMVDDLRRKKLSSEDVSRRDLSRMLMLKELIKTSTIIEEISPFPSNPHLCDIKFTVQNITTKMRREIARSHRLLISRQEGNNELYAVDHMIEELAYAIIAINGMQVTPAQVVMELRGQDEVILTYLYDQCITKIKQKIRDQIIDSARTDGLLGNLSGGAS